MSFLRNLFSGDRAPPSPTSSAPREAEPANSDRLGALGGAAAASLGPVLGPVASTVLGGGREGGSPSFPSGGSSLSAPDGSATEEEVQQYISLIVRGKNGADHQPGVMAQHADVILSNGAPAGFFGQGGGRFAGIGMGMDGVVADEDWFAANRPGYIDGDIAAAQNMSSTVLQIPVSPEQAVAFDEYWQNLAEDPGAFSILGDNCSTHAAEAFAAAGLIDGGINGLDTPDNLYNQLLERYPDAVSQSGFLDFDRAADGSWTHSIAPNSAPVVYPQDRFDGSSGQSALRSGETTAPSSGRSSHAGRGSS